MPTVKFQQIPVREAEHCCVRRIQSAYAPFAHGAIQIPVVLSLDIERAPSALDLFAPLRRALSVCLAVRRNNDAINIARDSLGHQSVSHIECDQIRVAIKRNAVTAASGGTHYYRIAAGHVRPRNLPWSVEGQGFRAWFAEPCGDG